MSEIRDHDNKLGIYCTRHVQINVELSSYNWLQLFMEIIVIFSRACMFNYNEAILYGKIYNVVMVFKNEAYIAAKKQK